MSTPDLSACPFCGGTDLRFGEIQEMEVGMSWPDYFVQCRSCQGSAGSGSRKEIAAEKWNRRVVPARITQLEARIVELEGQNKGLILTDAFLRQRPDLPVDRIPVYERMSKRIAQLEAGLKEAKDLVEDALKDTP